MSKLWFETEEYMCDTVVKMSQFKGVGFEVKELIGDDELYVIYKKELKYPDSRTFLFARFAYDDGEVYCSVVMHGRGYDGLRECRHTYWGDEGYIYYPDSKIIRTILDELEIHFDMD